MSATQDLHGRNGTPEHTPPPRTDRDETFDAIVSQIRERIERSALSVARRVGAFVLQNVRNLTIGLWESVRTASFLFVMFLFPYFAWASLGEVLIRRETLLGIAFGATMIAAPLGGASIALYRWWRANERTIAPPVVLRLVPEVDATVTPPLATTENFFEAAWKTLKVLFVVIDPRRLEKGLLFYLVVILGGAVAISTAMLLAPFGSALSGTFMAQPNLWLMAAAAATLRFLQQCLSFGVASVGAIFNSILRG